MGKKTLVLPILLALMGSVPPSSTSRILAIFPLNGKSHFVMFEPLMKILAERGHQVDVVSHFPQKTPFPNYQDIVSLQGTMPDVMNNVTIDFVKSTLSGSSVKALINVAGNQLCEFLGLPKMQELIKNSAKGKQYDLVITEMFAAHCYIAFGYHLKVPVVGLASSELLPWVHDKIGNPDNTAYIPNGMLPFAERMTFWERLLNTVFTLYAKLEFDYYTSPQDDQVRKYFGPDAPGVRDLERSVALILTNSHYSLTGIRPLTPAVVEVGGLHVQDNGPELSPELQKWLDESKDGFVFISFGSMVKIESLPKEMLAALYSSISKIAPVRVLMKIAKKDELPPGLPKNVLTLPWISQIKVLKHKNIRAFVTHGGLMGTQEALVHGVPLIGIPLFGDQIKNIETFVLKNMAVKINYDDINEANLDAAFAAIFKDPSYRIAAKELSAKFLDRPLSAADTAAFWIEYVIRNGPTALRSPVLDLTWWQVALLDVYGALLLAILLIGLLLRIIIGRLIAVIFRTGTNKVLPDKKRR